MVGAGSRPAEGNKSKKPEGPAEKWEPQARTIAALRVPGAEVVQYYFVALGAAPICNLE